MLFWQRVLQQDFHAIRHVNLKKREYNSYTQQVLETSLAGHAALTKRQVRSYEVRTGSDDRAFSDAVP